MVRPCHLYTWVGTPHSGPSCGRRFPPTPRCRFVSITWPRSSSRPCCARLRSLGEAVGRVDLLRSRTTDDPRAGTLDLAPLLVRPEGETLRFAGEVRPDAEGGELGERLAADAAVIAEEARVLALSYPIRNSDRAVGARLGGELGRAFAPDRRQVACTELRWRCGAELREFLARLRLTPQARRTTTSERD